jgi:hypothetical protein
MMAKKALRDRPWPRWLITACLLGSLAVGCQASDSRPKTDPEALKREAEKLRMEHERETHNR